jgi:hypothetical protein
VAVITGFAWIDHDVQATVRHAQARFGGDPVQALQCVVTSDACPLRERNRAVWALGRLGDPRAVPLLSACRTDRPCDHDHELCQYEVRKALARCRTGHAGGASGGHGHGHGRGHR